MGLEVVEEPATKNKDIDGLDVYYHELTDDSNCDYENENNDGDD